MRKLQSRYETTYIIFLLPTLGHENYYPKFGFEPADKWNIKAPFDVPTNAFMEIELKQEGLKSISGTVIYPKEFDTV